MKVGNFRHGNEASKAPTLFEQRLYYAEILKQYSNMAAEKKKRRKRRDSTSVLKPPLDFIESPLNGQKYYCTPVQAARRPFLAASLPVDDEMSMKWVEMISCIMFGLKTLFFKAKSIILLLSLFFQALLLLAIFSSFKLILSVACSL